MRVISDATLVTGSPAGPVTFHPGSPVDLPPADAKDLIARGLARPMPAPLPEFLQQEREHPGTGEPMREVDGDTLDTRINLNTATSAQLTAIKGVGKKTASDIVAHRKKGEFKSLEDAANRVGGVSLEQLQAADVTI